MKILSEAPLRVKSELPKGKLNVRFRQMRCMYQCFAGRTYLPLACGDTAEQAISELKAHYNVSADAEISIH